jgi:hypothetical protein
VQCEARLVRPGQAPAPSTVGASCAYVLLRSDGHFYAGSTDSLYDRIRAHRQVWSGGVGAAQRLAARSGVLQPMHMVPVDCLQIC